MKGFYYRDIFIQDNPWYGDNEPLHGTSFLKTDNEPRIMVCTPDVETYCDTEEEAKIIIDSWILKNGSYEWYTRKSDREIGW